MNATHDDYVRDFRKCESQDDAKQLYKKLVFELHPDRHPQEESEQWTEAVKQLNAAFATYMSRYAREKAYARQEEAHKDGRKSQADYVDVEELAEEWRRIVEAALNLNVDVEIIGLWIWATGPNTYAAREALKELGFRWAKKKDDRTAYFNDMGVKSFSRGGYTMDDIRSMHYSTKVKRHSNRNDKEEEETPATIPANATA